MTMKTFRIGIFEREFMERRRGIGTGVYDRDKSQG